MMLRMNYLTRYAHGAAAYNYEYLLFSITTYMIGSQPHILHGLTHSNPHGNIPRKYSIFKCWSSDDIKNRQYAHLFASFNYTEYHGIYNEFNRMDVHIMINNIIYITMYFMMYVLSTSLLYNQSDVIQTMEISVRFNKYGPSLPRNIQDIAYYNDPKSQKSRQIHKYILSAIVSHHLLNTTFYGGLEHANNTLLQFMIRTKYPAHHKFVMSEFIIPAKVVITKHLHVHHYDKIFSPHVLIDWAQ